MGAVVRPLLSGPKGGIDLGLGSVLHSRHGVRIQVLRNADLGVPHEAVDEATSGIIVAAS